jgi:hypothetical protein
MTQLAYAVEPGVANVSLENPTYKLLAKFAAEQVFTRKPALRL